MKTLFLFIFLFFSSLCIAQNDYYLGENYYREGAYEKATQIFKKLYDKSPFNLSYLNRLISCYQETEKFLEAERLITLKLKAQPKQGFLYVLLGYNYERQKQKKLASKKYTLALKSIDENPSYGAITGKIFKDYNLLDNAILAYQKTMAKNKNADYNFQIAQIYGEKGALQEMFESYINLVDENEKKIGLIQRYVSKYITNDAENEANVLFKKTLLKKAISNPKNVWNVLLSWLFTQQKEYTKAFLQEKALYRRNPTDLFSIFKLGKIAFQNKEYLSAKECVDFITQKETSNAKKIDAFFFITKIAVATNDAKTEELFQSLFDQFGKQQQTLKLQVAYADFLTFQKNNPKKAKEILNHALALSNSKFDQARVKLKLADVLVFTGKYNKALIYYSQIQTQLKNHELAQQARFKVAQTSYFKGDFTWAKAQLKVLKGATTQLIANDATALFLIITDNEPVDSIPSGLTQYASADLLAFQNKTKQAIDTLSLINTYFKGQPIEDEALFTQAKLHIKLKNYKAAISNFEKIISLDSEGILIDDAYYELAELYNHHLKEKEKALKYYEKIIFDYASSIYLVDARKKYRKLRGDTI